MDFSLSTEQEALARTTAEIARRHRDSEELWRALARAGLTSLTWSEDGGGGGASAVELVLVAEELGRAARVAPLAETVLAAALLDRSEDTVARETLTAMAVGDCRVVPALEELAATWSTTQTAVTAAEHPSGWRLSGTKEPVRYAATADRVLAPARDEAGRLRLFLVVTAATSDRVVLDDAPGWPVDLPGDVGAALDEAADLARVAVLGQQLGLMSAALEQTVVYLGVRKQYGSPLARFQALAHRAAEMLVRTETARSAAQYAAMALAADPGAASAVARAQLVVDAAARWVTQEAVQLHGGIGLTAEHSVGGYLADVVRLSAGFGGVRRSRRLLSRLVADSPSVDVLD